MHLLVIYKQHATSLAQLVPQAGNELFELLAWIEKKYSILGGGFAMRFGDTNYSAGTVNHIHVQFIQPDIDASNYRPVKIKIGKG